MQWTKRQNSTRRELHLPAWNQIPFIPTTMQAVRRNGDIVATQHEKEEGGQHRALATLTPGKT